MDDSAPWKTKETTIGLPKLPVLSGLSRFGGCHLSPPRPHRESANLGPAASGAASCDGPPKGLRQQLGELFGHFQQDTILFALSHFNQGL